MENRLYVGNLPFSATDEELKQAFSPHGTVTEVAIISDRVTGRSRGFAFVTMSSPDEANAASSTATTSRMPCAFSVRSIRCLLYNRCHK